HTTTTTATSTPSLHDALPIYRTVLAVYCRLHIRQGWQFISRGGAHYPGLCYASLRGIPTGLLEDSSPPHPYIGASLQPGASRVRDRKSTRLNSSHVAISYAVF